MARTGLMQMFDQSQFKTTVSMTPGSRRLYMTSYLRITLIIGFRCQFYITKTRLCNSAAKKICAKNFDIFHIFAQNIDCGYM